MDTGDLDPDLLLRQVRFGLGGPVTDVLIRDGRIAGDLRAPDVEEFDGGGGTLLPGLRDMHVHMNQWAIGLQRVDLATADSAAAAVLTAAAAAAAAPDVVWGSNFRDGLWPDLPHKDLLEAALPGRPVALISNDLHCAWLSPAALALIGVDHPTGVLREAAAFDAIGRLPQPPEQLTDAWVLAAARAAATRGVTQILDFEFIDTAAAWQRRAQHGRLPTRVVAAIHRPLLDRMIDQGRRTGQPVDGTAGLVTTGPCKVLIDGSLNTRTAYCSHHYPGTDSFGLLTEDPAELAGTIRRAAGQGISFAVHAIGDAANRMALDCFAAAGTGGRIEHAQLVDDVDLDRFAALGVVASVQPAHAPEDRDVADLHWVGRTGWAFPYRALLDAGATLEFGSDAPVSRLDPWHAIAAAVFRTDDDRTPWHPEQSLTLGQAIAASTGGGTAPVVGAPADLVLTGREPVGASRAELSTMPVRLTTVGGRITHRAG